MKRKRITEKSKELLNGKFGQVFLGLLVVIAFNFILGYLLDIVLPIEELVDVNEIENIFQSGFNLNVTLTWKSFLRDFINSTFNSFLFGAFIISILRFIRRRRMNLNTSYKVSDFFDAISAYFPKMIVTAIIIGLIGALLNLIPFVGWILSTIVGIILSFIYLIIEDNPDASIQDIFILSNERTKGHKKDIFIFQLIYQFAPLLIYVIAEIIIIFLLLVNGDPYKYVALFGMLTVIFTILFIVFFIRYTIFYQMLIAVLYEYEIAHDPDNLDFTEEIYDDTILDDYNNNDTIYDDTNYMADSSSSDEYYNNDSINENEVEVIYKDEDGNIIDKEEI